MSAVRPVDLDQLAADIHDLTVAYQESLSQAVRYASSGPLSDRISALTSRGRDRLSQAERAELRRLLTQRDRVWAKTDTPDGLLEQLGRTGQHPTQHAGRGGWVSGGKPGSRPPAGLGHMDLLADIETAVWVHHDELRDELDDWAGVDWTRAPGGRVEWDPRPWQVVLATLPGLVERLKDDPAIPVDPAVTGRVRAHPLAAALARDVRQWRAQCRVLLGYTVPSTTLQATCPACLQYGRLTVREDASSDVACRARLPLPSLSEETMWVVCGETWDRRSWVSLLVQVEAKKESA